MKIIILSALAVVCLAEPPVDNRYLPPQQGGFGGPPSTLYGAPVQRQTDAVFSRQSSRRPSNQYIPPSSKYGAPSHQQLNAPSTQYGAPGKGMQMPSSQYGAPSIPSNQYIPAAPSSQYGAPSAPSSQYGAPSAPSSQYGAPSAPSSQYGAPSSPSSQYGAPSAPSSQYGAPSAPSSQYGAPSAPSSQYGAPGFGGSDAYSQGGSFRGQEQSRQYLPPGAGSRGGYGDDGSNGEPANYSFEYMVKDEPSGNDFGHRESRMGDRAEGLYYVLLPDDRKQTVEYEADQNGYKPRISYEDTGLGQGGYGRGNQGGFNGYENQGGPY